MPAGYAERFARNDDQLFGPGSRPILERVGVKLVDVARETPL
jgi:hypothetical protein